MIWDDFVVDAVQTDVSLAHLFVWALTSVASNPSADPVPRKEAEKKLSFVAGVLAGQVHLTNVQAMLKAADEAARNHRTLPQVPRRNPNSISPLVDLLQRLHHVGQQIVEVKDRPQRLITLRQLIEKDINPKLQDKTPVPVAMLAPSADRREPQAESSTASLLRLTISEARVLSSKARAPYLVVLEVEQAEKAVEQSTERDTGLWGMLTCSRRAKSSSSSSASGRGLTAKKQVAWHPSLAADSSGTSVSQDSFAGNKIVKPRGCFKDETWEEVVKRVRKTTEFGSRLAGAFFRSS